MSFAGFFFVSWRIFQILTLIPIVGMLSWFVHEYTELNSLTPNSILVLFIVSVLALAWTVGTLFLYARARHSGKFVAFVDLLFLGALIAGVVELRSIAKADCSNFRENRFYFSLGSLAVQGTGYHLDVNRSCAMLKASWALAIIDILTFFVTFFLALMVHHHYKDRDHVVVKRETHVSRHGHRSSRSPRRSHHSSRRSYHV
ncbi:hypothetical protein GQ43DRAFT_430150 [Delitschia confertaspora ATCC 74209]|uniref:MARVEL domain-containing protein n=1 Tax=Delitschia confertaspora ATCC 74209 TaxID=1513339 RepID=A0A9P4JPG1_9PLEO|nr:hypothetical protein GQ43DRAFT_430150 [Delitschia confertaspora ATCC 74209]